MLRRFTTKPVVEGLESRVVLTPLGGHAAVHVDFPTLELPEQVPAEVEDVNLPGNAADGLARAAAGQGNGGGKP